MTYSLLLTIFIEGVIVLGFAVWQRKPVRRLLLANLLANLLTQPALWIMLGLFFRYYLTALILSEIFIWLFESAFMRLFPGSRLDWKEALLLSLVTNLASFGLGSLIEVLPAFLACNWEGVIDSM